MKRRVRSPLGMSELESRLTPSNTPPMLVRDIQPNSLGSNPMEPLAIGSQLYFAANGGIEGNELWTSDGTSGGTTLVRDINPGSVSSSSNPAELTEVNGRFFFTAETPATGRELWVSDGTSTGTQLVLDIEQFGSSYPSGLTNVGGKLFFYASTNMGGREAWVSDGTAAGTTMIADLASGPLSSVGSEPGVNVGGIFYFPASDFTFQPINDGSELWRSDGTAKGTFLVRDINPGGSSSSPQSLVEFNGKVAFAANDGNNFELWISDGTSTGTTKISNTTLGTGTGAPAPGNLTNVGGTLFFTASSTAGVELFKTDGTSSGTALVRDINPGGVSSYPSGLTNVGGTLFFSARDGVNGNELWTSDGTSTGTQLIYEISPGPSGYGVAYITNVGGVAYFAAATADVAPELWRSDGTSTGTSLIDLELTSRSDPTALIAAGNRLYFTGFRSDVGRELFSLDEDNIGPAITAIDSPDADGSYYTGQSVTITLTFSEAATLSGGNLTITLDTGAVLTITPFTDALTITAVYTVAAGESSADLNVVGLALSSGATLTDAVGNAADLTLPQQNLAVLRDLMINLPLIPPTISDTPDQFVNAGNTIGPLAIFLSDFDSTTSPLVLSVTSDNPGLIPASAVTFGGAASDRTITILTQPGLTGIATLTVTVTDPDGLTSTDTITITQNGPPTITGIANQNVIAGTTVGPLAFTVGGNFTAPDMLLLSVTSDNAAIPPSAVTFGGGGANRTIAVPTTAGVSASTTLTVTVTDPSNGFTSSTSFIITQAPNAAPTISDIGNVVVVEGGTVGPLNFTIGDAESPTDSLSVTATSSDLALIPASAITLGGGGANRTITITTTSGTTGTATITVTVTDPFGASVFDTFTVTITAAGSPVSPFAVGRGPEVSPGLIRVFNADLTERFSFAPFGPDYDCGIRVVMADFTGDGIEDIAAGTRYHNEPGHLNTSRVAVFDGVTLTPLFEIEPFGASYINGINLSAGDMTGDGRAELAISADFGGGARIRVFTPGSAGFVQRADFIALQDANGVADTRFRGGARTAIGDLDGDGFGDLFFAAGIGGGPRVAVFDGQTLGPTGGPKLRGDFFAFEANLRNGANIAVGDINGDGKVELVASASSGGAPRVSVFDGDSLLQGSLVRIADFFAGDSTERSGVRVAVKDLDGDGLADIIAGAGPNIGNNVWGYRGSDILAGGTITPFFDFEAFPGDTVGVWVG